MTPEKTIADFIKLQIGAIEARIANTRENSYDRSGNCNGIIIPPTPIMNGFQAELQYWKDQL